MAKKKQLVTSLMLKPIQIICNNGELKGLPKNPRLIRDKEFKELKKSIKDCPEMTEIREVVVYTFKENYIVIAGNMRFRAMSELKFKQIPCKVLDKSISVVKLREIASKDNIHSGKDDWEIINSDWNIKEIASWGKVMPTKSEKKETNNIKITIVDVQKDERENIKSVLREAGYTVK